VILEDDWHGMYFQPDNMIPIDPYEAWYEDRQLADDIPDLLN
jgi:hypothetical protein